MKARRITAAVLWLLTAAALAAVWAAGGGALWLGAAIAVLLLPGVSLLLALAARRGVRLSLTLTPTVPKRAAAQAVLLVKNDALLSARALFRVRAVNALTREETVTLLRCTVPPKGTEELRFLVESRRCGQITAAVEKAGLLDICGIFAVPLKTENIAARTTALPDMFAPGIDLALASSMPEESDSYAPGCRGNDLTEIFQLREYAPGDDLRRIHWKMTAKTDRLIVREASLPLQRSLLVFWDKTAADKLAPDAADALAESVSSVCQSLSEQGYAYQLGWPEGGTARFAEAGSTEELLRDLPLLLRGGAEPLQETGALRGFGKILYFTASPDPVWRSLTAGAEPVLLLCGVPEQPDVRCICYTKEDYAAALQQLEL